MMQKRFPIAHIFLTLVILSTLCCGGSSTTFTETHNHNNLLSIIPAPKSASVDSENSIPLDKTMLVLETDNSPQLKYAAESIQKELHKIHDVDAILSKTDEKISQDITLLLLGNRANKKFVDLCQQHGISVAYREKPPSEGFVIKGHSTDGKKIIAIAGNDPSGVIYGSFAFLQLVRDGKVPASFTIEDYPSMPVRFYRPAETNPPWLTPIQRKLADLDWCARWRCNYTSSPPVVEDPKSGEKLDVIAECKKRGIKVITMLKEVKQYIVKPGTTSIEEIKEKTEEYLKIGYQGFHVTFDDIDPKFVIGKVEKLAKDQIKIIEAIHQICEKYGCSENVFWCPTYYSSVVDKGWYKDKKGKEQDLYFRTLATSEIVRKSPMYHCHYWKDYTDYLNRLGFKNLIWWYNGVRPIFYIYPPKYCKFKMMGGWWNGINEVGDLPKFVWGWHLLFTDMPYKPDAGRPLDIPPQAWSNLRSLAERFRGIYNCTGSNFREYNHALYGVFSWNPARFNQEDAEAVILDDVFGKETAKQLRKWSNLYDDLVMEVGLGSDRSEKQRQKVLKDLKLWKEYTDEVCHSIDKATHILPDQFIKYYQDCLRLAVTNMEKKIATAYKVKGKRIY